jgi:hypothetical protein
MSFLKRLFQAGAKTEIFLPLPPPTDDAVARAESDLGILFPISFVSFLRESRPMQLPLAAQFYCISDGRHGVEDIVAANRREREASSPLPHFMVAFYNDGMGNQVCFDTRHPSDGGEYPIVFWDHELGADENLEASLTVSRNRESAGIVASSFPDWIQESLKINYAGRSTPEKK